jgi:hypothetical protein
LNKKVAILSKAKKLFLLCLILFSSAAPLIAAPSAGEILRSEELMEEDRYLREEIESKKTVFIDTIIVEGMDFLPAERIAGIIAPFEHRRLTREDIQQIRELLMQAYRDTGGKAGADLSYSVRENVLSFIFTLSHKDSLSGKQPGPQSQP